MRLRALLVAILVLVLSTPAYADQAKAAYKRGARAEAHRQYDAAYQAYKQAYTLKPNEPKYLAAYARLRVQASAEHVRVGQSLRDSLKLQESLAEFQFAAEIDSSNFVAQQELRRITDTLRKQAQQPGVAIATKLESPLAKKAGAVEGPVDLEFSSDTPLTLRMTNTADVVYKTIGKMVGINVLFDLDYKPQRITIELNDVKASEALRMVALESKTFWRPIATNAIFVTAESRRKEYEDNVMKTFYLRNVSTPNELQEVVNTLKGILDINRIQVNPTHSAITLRGTLDQMILAEKLVSDMDKPKAEVVIDIMVMQISRDRLYELGTNVPTSTSVALQSAIPGAGTGPGNLVKLGSLNGNNFVVTVPGATFTLLTSDSNTKILQKPEVRALNDEKASLKIGDRVPIATGSFTPGIGASGISPLVNTQFQYLDVGVNIDITPHVHSDQEVTLKMVLEISSVTGSQNIGGITQPVIGQRRIQHETRLGDGDINLVGGILEDSETRSLSGYPWLTKIPLLKYLFGQENKDRRENEIVFAITPHIVRAENITDENLRLLDIGAGNSIGLHFKEQKTSKPSGSTPPATPPPQSGLPQTPSPQPTPQQPPQPTLPTGGQKLQ